MAITVVCGTQRVTVVERSEGDDEEASEVCNIGRRSSTVPVDVSLGQSDALSRRAVQVRCVDGSWWQIRQTGVNGVSLKTERGVVMPVSVDWADVPARFGEAYVTVTTLTETFEFKVEPNVSGVPPPRGHGENPAQNLPAPLSRNVSTRVIPRVGYWRVAVALCEPALADGSERIPTTPEIVRRLDRLGLEVEGFTDRAVEKRIKYLYGITGIEPGDRIGLRRRLIDSQVVTKDDVSTLLAAP